MRGRGQMQGQSPKVVNVGPKPDAGPKPDVGPKPKSSKCRPDRKVQEMKKAKVNVEEQRKVLQSGDSDFLAIFVEGGWKLSVEIPRSWM
ncbi:hypothetical protein CDL15_Pgr012313 [Punica granatum]|uniref:Uncharacterized protein n=1 Tax=Punica granatum TaxID=22663 RepID=A0A218VXD6_PUNGR|nr:hypothetical protein CDL15_Pgr012313 [Punica granatum]